MEHEDAVQLVRETATALAKDSIPGSGLVSELFATIGRALGGTADERFEKAVRQEIHNATFERLPELDAKVAALEKASVRINATDIARVMTNYAKAWRDSADEKKRSLLEAAFLRSFDKELYESGILNALWERLDRLSYGDLVVLQDLLSVVASSDKDAVRKAMSKHGLNHADGLGAFHVSNLVREGLAWSDAPPGSFSVGNVRPTEFGKRLRSLAFGI